MAYSVIKAGDCGDSSIGYYYEYLCESTADIANLPTTAAGGGPRPGSLAYIESDSSARYILKINREWGEYPMASGGGSTGGGVFVVHMTMSGESAALDATAGEIISAVQSDKAVFIVDNAYWGEDGSMSEMLLDSVTNSGESYEFVFGGDVTMYADTLDDYPSMSVGG